MIDYVLLVECMLNPGKLTEGNNTATCYMMLKGFVTRAEWDDLRSKMPNSFGDIIGKTKALYRFAHMLEASDKTLQEILCSQGWSYSNRLSIHKSIGDYFYNFIKDCKDIDALMNLLSNLNTGDDYDLKWYKESCRNRIQYLQQQITKPN